MAPYLVDWRKRVWRAWDAGVDEPGRDHRTGRL